jgi:hypothetical protein
LLHTTQTSSDLLSRTRWQFWTGNTLC